MTRDGRRSPRGNDGSDRNDDERIIATLSRAARDVAAAESSGPSPAAWHRLTRPRKPPLPGPPRRTLWVAVGVAAFASLLGVFKIVALVRAAPLTYAVRGALLRSGGQIDALGSDAALVRFSDGTEIALDAGAHLAVTASGPHGAHLRLHSGRAHLQVIHRPAAAWTVEAGPYAVEVTGTAFDLRWSEAEQIAEIKMQAGSVRVSGPLLSEKVALGKGQHLMARLRSGDVRIDDGRLADIASPARALPPGPAPVVPVAPEAIAGNGKADAAGAAAVAAVPGYPVRAAAVAQEEIAASHSERAPSLPLARRPRVRPRLALAGAGPSSSAPAPASATSDGEPSPLDQPTSWMPAPMPGTRATGATFQPGQEVSADAGVVTPIRPPGLAPTTEGVAPKWVERRWASQVAVGDSRTVVADAERLGVDTTLRDANGRDLAAFADAARYAGRPELADKAMKMERQRFPGTARARAAAFLLGRMAEDRGDAPSGLTWYRSYLAESPGGPYAAEALGRAMLAVEHLQGRGAALPIAREYLGRFPNGTYLLQARAIVDNR